MSDPAHADTSLPDSTQASIGTGGSSAVREGSVLGRYQLRGRLGEGGMGSVWAAHDPDLERTVAVKVLRDQLASREGEQRLRREAQTMARLAHPNVIQVFDVGVAHDTLFVAMEYVADGTLKDWLARAPRSADEILAIFAKAGRGLAAAHDAGLVHRDFKPTNVLVAGEGRVLVSDFGVARPVTDAAVDALAETLDKPVFQTLTNTGGIVGTPLYMAPEQHEGVAVDARADQFSFCVALWHALYDAMPFSGATLVALALAKAAGTPAPPPRNTRVPPHVRAVLERGLSADPAARFPTMHALLAALATDPRHRRRRRAMLAAGVVALVGAGAAVSLLARQPHEDPCDTRTDHFAGVWDATRRAEVEAAFVATKLPFARTAFAEVARQLDAREASWRRARLESCRATHVRKEQSTQMMDLRAACLERKWGEVRAFVDALRVADAAAVRAATPAVATVGNIESCNDVATLARRIPLPDAPAARAAIADVERQLTAARASLTVGRQNEIPADLVQRARSVGYAPVLAEALMVAGEAASNIDHAAESEKLFEQALLAAEAGGDDAIRFAAEAYLVQVVGFQLERDQDAERHAERAEALLTRLGPDPRRVAELSRRHAQSVWWAGRFAEAKTIAQRAVDELATVDPEGAEMARALHLRAILEQELHENEASVATEEKARAIAERAVGAQHPMVGQMWNTSGGSLRNLGRYDEALQHLQHALAIAEATDGPRSSEVAVILVTLATLWITQDKPLEAIPLLERASDINLEVHGPEHGRTRFGFLRLGSAYSRAGRNDDAVRILTRAIELYRKKEGPESSGTADAITKLGEHYLRARQPKLAREQLLEAVRAFEVAGGPSNSELAKPLMLLGRAERSLEHQAAATAAWKRALAVVVDDDELRAEIQTELAH